MKLRLLTNCYCCPKPLPCGRGSELASNQIFKDLDTHAWRSPKRKPNEAPASKGDFERATSRPKNLGKNSAQAEHSSASSIGWLSGLQRKPRRASKLRLVALTPSRASLSAPRTYIVHFSKPRSNPQGAGGIFSAGPIRGLLYERSGPPETMARSRLTRRMGAWQDAPLWKTRKSILTVVACVTERSS